MYHCLLAEEKGGGQKYAGFIYAEFKAAPLYSILPSVLVEIEPTLFV